MRITLTNPPRYFELGKRVVRKYYLTAQIFYSGIHWTKRSELVKMAKEYLHPFLKKVPQMASMRLRMDFEGKVADLDNKAYFWNKMVQDYFTKNGTIPDDNTKYIDELHYTFKPTKTDKIILTIKEKK